MDRDRELWEAFGRVSKQTWLMELASSIRD